MTGEQISGLVIPLASLAVAALSVCLMYKSRTAIYKQTLYSKQLEGCAEICIALCIHDSYGRN